MCRFVYFLILLKSINHFTSFILYIISSFLLINLTYPSGLVVSCSVGTFHSSVLQIHFLVNHVFLNTCEYKFVVFLPVTLILDHSSCLTIFYVNLSIHRSNSSRSSGHGSLNPNIRFPLRFSNLPKFFNSL